MEEVRIRRSNRVRRYAGISSTPYYSTVQYQCVFAHTKLPDDGDKY